MKKCLFVLAVLFVSVLSAQHLPPVFDQHTKYFDNNDRVTKYLAPVRIVWQSHSEKKYIDGVENLLRTGTGQAELPQRNLCRLTSDAKVKPSFVLDFGKEIHGGIQLVTGMMKLQAPVRLHIILGESVSEVMNSGQKGKGATNDHAMRDFVLSVPWLGVQESGNSGYRFARIELEDFNSEVLLKETNAIFIYRDLPYKGSFKCSDKRLDDIWLTGAYTVHLNMQQYLWDGIKRDRLVWVGDMNPEVMTINTVFGYNEVVPRSLDIAKDQTPLPGWMNGISTYSMWWIITHRDWYYYQGDKKYLQQQKGYLLDLIDFIISKIDKEGKEMMDGNRFIDWPTSEKPDVIHAGLQGMTVLALTAGAELCTILNEPASAEKCRTAISRLKKYIPDAKGNKQAAAIMSLSGILDQNKAAQIIAEGGAKNFSTFYGYYMLQALAKAGKYDEALDIIKAYWGAMLDLGATTFWEDFNLDWLPASRIDEPVKAGVRDIHGDCGDYCYKGLRHSFCHGWASGPTTWLTQHVLGITVVEPGAKVVRIKPHLGHLKWAEGTFPTPYGIISVRHENKNGKIISKISAPKEVRILR